MPAASSARDVSTGIGTRAPKHDAGAVGLGRNSARYLRSARCRTPVLGTDQDLGPARYFRLDALDPRRVQVDGVIERQRSVQHALQ